MELEFELPDYVLTSGAIATSAWKKIWATKVIMKYRSELSCMTRGGGGAYGIYTHFMHVLQHGVRKRGLRCQKNYIDVEYLLGTRRRN